MRKITYIVFGLLCSLTIKAAKVTATIEAYNKASLSGDIAGSMMVDFTNSSGSKGKVGQGHTAILTISGWPRTTIQAVTLFMRSNKSSGSASVFLSLGKDTWQVAEGEFASWPGITGYSTENVSFPSLAQPCDLGKGESLVVQVVGSENSVYLQQVVVDYIEPDPVPSVLTLVSLDPSGEATKQALKETTVGEGFVLPDVENYALMAEDEIWHFIGWCPQKIDAQSIEPVYYQSGDRYFCDDYCWLYALYTNVAAETLCRDTSFVSGEYALAIQYGEEVYALSSAWVKGHISMEKIDAYASAFYGLVWSIDVVDENLRYALSFEGDSLTCQHIASKSWIGHTDMFSSKTRTKWAWQRVRNGSILIYSKIAPVDTIYAAQCLTLREDMSTFEPYACFSEDVFEPNYPYWYLFPVSKVPLPSELCYTTFPERTPIEYIMENPPVSPCVKTMDQHGRLLINMNNQSFTILGEKL